MTTADGVYADAERVLRARSSQPEEGCWIWHGTSDSFGYGSLRFREQLWKAHRLAYVVWVGPLADGLVVDHLCRHEPCIRPDHLEAVSRRENTLRGNTGFAGRTTCMSGRHDITDPANLRRSGNHFMCRLCGNEREARRRARARRQRQT